MLHAVTRSFDFCIHSLVDLVNINAFKEKEVCIVNIYVACLQIAVTYWCSEVFRLGSCEFILS